MFQVVNLMMSNSASNNSEIQGSFTFNSECYSINDLVTALLAQGVTFHKVGTNLKVGQKIINPVANSPVNYSQRSNDQINENVIQGLASQIQRIFSELNKLKDHIGVNNNIVQDLVASEKKLFDFSSFDDKSTASKSFGTSNKWDSFVPSKNFDLQPDKYESKSGILNLKNDTPIITLGRKKQSSLIDEYTDLVTNKGIPDDDALDSLSSKLFSTANGSLANLENKQDLRTALLNQTIEKSPVATEYTTFLFTKCDHCSSKIPNEAQFCSKCGKKK